MNNIKCLGVDVSKDNITCHCLQSYPQGGLTTYWEKTRVKESKLYPRFYSNPNKKQKQKSPWDFLKWLDQEKPDYAILEPTGVHYSKLWGEILKSQGVKVLWVGHMELKRFRQGKNLKGHIKNDAVDALAMASYLFDIENKLPDGSINPKKFLREQPDSILKLRQLVQYQEHLNKVQSPIVNYFRQLLTWQFPEMQTSKAVSFYKWLAGEEITAGRQKNYDQDYQESIAYGLFEIDPHLRIHSHWLTEIIKEENRLMKEINEIMKLPIYDDYNEIFNFFRFGDKVRAKLLTRIYPFENFLVDEQEFIEYERREVKKEERSHKDGVTYVKYQKGQVKRIKRNRSRDSFKLRLGFGTILESSGDGYKMTPHGSALCKKSVYQYVHTTVMPEHVKLPDNEIIKEILDYEDKLSSIDVLKGVHLQSKLMSKIINLLYREFKIRFCF
jgi:hypothetical protein